MYAKQSFSERNAITLKAIVVVVLVLLMLIPVNMVTSLVEERQSYKEVVKNDIAAQWGGCQHLTGPILVLPYLKKPALEKENGTAILSYAYFLPDEYSIEGLMKIEPRSRGIYEVLCYKSNLQVKGSFVFPDYRKLRLEPESVLWNEAFLLVGVPYLQGIKKSAAFNINGKQEEIIAGVSINDVIPTEELTDNTDGQKDNRLLSQANWGADGVVASGFAVKMPINRIDANEKFNFDFNLVLDGTDALLFTPIGKRTSIHLTSEYGNIGFAGSFLPNTSKVDSKGFDAQWNVFDYNRNFPQMWQGKNALMQNACVGVNLLLPIDQYQKNMRSVKYAIIFIALTFTIFFMVEHTGKKTIHPLQYLLVSFALVLFYSLLLAFSEHIGFDWAYLISALAIICLITAYSHTIFKNKRSVAYMGIFLSVLYMFLYIVVRLEDMALLLGSIGLFITLASVMYASRKINWYNERGENRGEEK
jgi:inner membrane protein